MEAKTYRFYGHTRSDPRLYRTREEEKEWKSKDPIQDFENKLIEWGVMTSDKVKELEGTVTKEIQEAKEFALSSP